MSNHFNNIISSRLIVICVNVPGSAGLERIGEDAFVHGGKIKAFVYDGKTKAFG